MSRPCRTHRHAAQRVVPPTLSARGLGRSERSGTDGAVHLDRPPVTCAKVRPRGPEVAPWPREAPGQACAPRGVGCGAASPWKSDLSTPGGGRSLDGAPRPPRQRPHGGQGETATGPKGPCNAIVPGVDAASAVAAWCSAAPRMGHGHSARESRDECSRRASPLCALAQPWWSR